MRWQDLRRSDNVEDRRGLRLPGGAVGGGLGLVVVVIIALVAGVDPRQLLQGVGAGTGTPGAGTPAAGAGTAQNDSMRDFVSAVLGSTEETWNEVFRASGGAYRDPTLVMYSGATESACGLGQAAMGPFYCPNDERVYIDLSFYDELRSRFQAPGDFAQAYVIAHEVGHHVQKLLGVEDQVRRLRSRQSEEEANATSVRLELQADCYAGVWARRADAAKPLLESGDVEEGLAAAAAVGDDRLQRQTQGTVMPETFTHGTSEQRVRWFRRGLDSGDPGRCDTFNSTL
jgi:predicted metalloprotease